MSSRKFCQVRFRLGNAGIYLLVEQIGRVAPQRREVAIGGQRQNRFRRLEKGGCLSSSVFAKVKLPLARRGLHVAWQRGRQPYAAGLEFHRGRDVRRRRQSADNAPGKQLDCRIVALLGEGLLQHTEFPEQPQIDISPGCRILRFGRHGRLELLVVGQRRVLRQVIIQGQPQKERLVGDEHPWPGHRQPCFTNLIKRNATVVVGFDRILLSLPLGLGPHKVECCVASLCSGCFVGRFREHDHSLRGQIEGHMNASLRQRRYCLAVGPAELAFDCLYDGLKPFVLRRSNGLPIVRMGLHLCGQRMVEDRADDPLGLRQLGIGHYGAGEQLRRSAVIRDRWGSTKSQQKCRAQRKATYEPEHDKCSQRKMGKSSQSRMRYYPQQGDEVSAGQ
jgi:hypothetical protein